MDAHRAVGSSRQRVDMFTRACDARIKLAGLGCTYIAAEAKSEINTHIKNRVEIEIKSRQKRYHVSAVESINTWRD
jgi:hypothetical protein